MSVIGLPWTPQLCDLVKLFNMRDFAPDRGDMEVAQVRADSMDVYG